MLMMGFPTVIKVAQQIKTIYDDNNRSLQLVTPLYKQVESSSITCVYYHIYGLTQLMIGNSILSHYNSILATNSPQATSPVLTKPTLVYNLSATVFSGSKLV